MAGNSAWPTNPMLVAGCSWSCENANISVAYTVIEQSTLHSQFPIFAILTTPRNCDCLVRTPSKKTTVS